MGSIEKCISINRLVLSGKRKGGPIRLRLSFSICWGGDIWDKKFRLLLTSLTFWIRKFLLFQTHMESGCLTSFDNLQELKHPFPQQ